MYLILCGSYLNHSLRFVGEKKRIKKKSHIKSQSQYFGKKSQLDYFPKWLSPTLACHGLVTVSMVSFPKAVFVYQSSHKQAMWNANLCLWARQPGRNRASR